MFKEYQKEFRPSELENEILAFWEERGIFEKSVRQNADGPRFVFYEGPPTANGKPGIHHVISRTIKDLVCRYYTMLGYHVPRKAGWDTHGLPVEIEIEKLLGINGKEQIESYGVEKFNQLCRDSVFKYVKEWEQLTQRMGYWLDYRNPYITYDRNYIESVWWLLKQIWDKGLLYSGYKIVPYCPRCETPLSSHEVSLGYKEVTDPSVFVKMRLADEPDTYFLVWTTTPWTLISNVALAVGPDHMYARVRKDGETLILAEALVEDLLGAEARIEATCAGRELAGRKYLRLFDFVDPPEGTEAFYVVPGDFVSLEDGTGIVHIAPAFGADDYELSRTHGLPLLQPVDKQGKFTAEVTPWAGRFVKHADKEIIENLRQRGLLFKDQGYSHNYPYCWRCDTPLLYYARASWYINTSRFKDQLLENSNSVNWFPPEVGQGRFAEWLENNVDWSLSRDRYWGTPLNIWVCEGCEHKLAVGSLAELIELGDNVPADIDLHKPYVDQIFLTCPECGGRMKRVPEVIDCWFDSGSMPFAQLHYPFDNREEFARNFPCNFICEAIDQTRGWFYSLLAIGTLVEGRSPYLNVLVNDLILDKNGQKMSKSLGNTVNPFDMFEKYGADPLRWYLLNVSQPWLPKRFDENGVGEVVRKFFDTLMNVYSFFALYANIDDFSPAAQAAGGEKKDELDRWIISRLNSVIRSVREDFSNFELTRITRTIQQFVIDDLSNWYVRRNRRRFWQSGDSADKRAAFATLWEVLTKVARLIAPVTPFIAETLYRNLEAGRIPEAPESVHLSRYPEAAAELIDEKLERKMADAERLVILGRSARNRSRIKVRQPLPAMLVQVPHPLERSEFESIGRIICDEINVKQIDTVESAWDYVTLTVKPNFKIAGPKFGDQVKALAGRLAQLNQDEIRIFRESGRLELSLNGKTFGLALEDVELRSADREGFVVETDGGYGVVLSTSVDRNLLDEGIARELVNKIQNMRKSAGFEVLDRIEVGVQSTAAVQGALDSFGDYIRRETLCRKLESALPAEHDLQQEWDINGEPAVITVRKIITENRPAR
ncbi:MAG: isoleucine--tRNA ligase [Candidatus Glassbacteria bacterium GWA2_58_10]|uniref:Isoleucine--tRNA ligase n=1 Tax=Candidatus Glassbacteria bacterium GWA2_58_10 TaxID=1817865 RepID=A0A1F5YH63_9BACT|nr:MAG: isoleucine--tRNA ligase [Candidatus Glassbacteria bacterium GWA2_58_10]